MYEFLFFNLDFKQSLHLVLRMSRIISIGTAVPQYGTAQNKIIDFMQMAYNDDTASRKLKLLFHHSGINTRYSVVSDFDGRISETNIFGADKPVPNVEKRLKIFKDNAASLAIEAIENSFQKLNRTIGAFGITHLITVTCTGIYAPGLNTELVEQLDLPNDIFHISVNYMGCNAAFPALKIADMITKTDEKAKVLVVCVEMCTLHFQPKDNDANLLANTIFGDGAAAVIVVSDAEARHNKQSGLEIDGFYSLLLADGKDFMAWNINPVNFEMVLDPIIPDFIGDHVNGIVSKAGKKLNISRSTIDKWAIHPGGKKILDSIKKRLELSDGDLQYSYKVLSEYGNMSSPTILFVLNEIMQTGQKPDETIFSIGFGPGISIEASKFIYAE